MRAAQYVRMSTEHQQSSIENQAAPIKEYADSRGFEVVRTYSDAARSGLDLKGRPGLSKLIRDVVGGRADFQEVLVFDVSRWGRFQDADESAHYEFVCKSAGIPIHYCAEPFSNADNIADTLLKTLKRSMAAEYIRELSGKVFAGQCRVARAGTFWKKQANIPTPFGFAKNLSWAGRVSHTYQRQRLERSDCAGSACFSPTERQFPSVARPGKI